MEKTEYIWLFVTVLFAVLEAIIPGVASIWFSVGAFAAFITAFLNGSFILQLIVFILVTVLVAFLTKPLIKKLSPKAPVPTNADTVIGSRGITKEKIDNATGKGTVFCNDRLWSAKSLDNTSIEEDTIIKVVKIEGVKLVVTPDSNSTHSNSCK